jgi:hypothetical protein
VVDADESTSLLLMAMDHAIERARVANAPLIPFVLADSGATPEYHRFAGEAFDDGVGLAARFIRTECRGLAAVLVYSGYVTQADARWDAIYAESVDASGEVTVVAQRYRPRRLLRSFELVGNPVRLAVKGVL